VGHGATLILVANYDEWLLLPFLMECYKFLMFNVVEEPLI
jgi:hypothetical protein